MHPRLVTGSSPYETRGLPESRWDVSTRKQKLASLGSDLKVASLLVVTSIWKYLKFLFVLNLLWLQFF